MKVKIFVVCFLISLISPLLLVGQEISIQDIQAKYYREYKKLDIGARMPKLLVDDTHIYICAQKQCRIYAFSRKDGKLTAEFGGRGEGPGEQRFYSSVVLYKNSIYAGNDNKIVRFSRDGKLLGETISRFYGNYFLPFGNGYVVNRIRCLNADLYSIEEEFKLYDDKLKDQGKLFSIQYKRPKGKNQSRKDDLYFFYHCRKAIVSGDELYIGCSDKGIYIAVFDLQGNKVREIKHDYEKIPVTQELKDRVSNIYKQIAKEMGTEEELKKRELVFHDFFPAFCNFFVGKDLIYLFKYPKPKSKGWVEILVMDKKGKVLKAPKIQLAGLYKTIQEPGVTAYHGGKLYFKFDHEEHIQICELDLEDIIKAISWKKKQ